MIAAILPLVLKPNGVSRFSRTVPVTTSDASPLAGATVATTTGTSADSAGGGGKVPEQAASSISNMNGETAAGRITKGALRRRTRLCPNLTMTHIA